MRPYLGVLAKLLPGRCGNIDGGCGIGGWVLARLHPICNQRRNFAGGFGTRALNSTVVLTPKLKKLKASTWADTVEFSSSRVVSNGVQSSFCSCSMPKFFGFLSARNKSDSS